MCACARSNRWSETQRWTRATVAEHKHQAVGKPITDRSLGIHRGDSSCWRLLMCSLSFGVSHNKACYSLSSLRSKITFWGREHPLVLGDSTVFAWTGLAEPLTTLVLNHWDNASRSELAETDDQETAHTCGSVQAHSHFFAHLWGNVVATGSAVFCSPVIVGLTFH